MMTRYSTVLALLCWLLTPMIVGAQGVTTANISGRILDAGSEPLIGATIVAVHEPTGTVYGNATDLDGYYRLANMRVGGPYTVTVSYTGYGSQEFTGVNLRLGENRVFDATLQDNTNELTQVVVRGQVGTAGTNAGASTQISTEQIEGLPTLNRDISDFTRLTPQSSSVGGGTSFGGVNNRFNAIYIDGAVNNDVFGLSSDGTNGGQTGASPFSIDIIDQFQIVLSPYDVSLGGFAGAGVNAVTKSGTNQFKGTAYLFNQNESIAGKTPGRLADRLIEDGDPDFERTKLEPFNRSTYGASFGGPIVKDKVFFFLNAELIRDETPAPFEFGQYVGNSNEADIDRLRSRLLELGYDPGTFGNTSDALDADRIFAKLDFNLTQDHRLTLRHNYNKASSFDRNASNRGRINFSNNGIFFPSTTNSSALELNSTFGTAASNNLILGYTKVLDDRDPLGQAFPNVFISDGDGSITFGSEAFSTGNVLEQSIFTLTDNFKLYRGPHTFTLGTHNEFYSIRNVFVRQNFGSYFYRSLEGFLSNGPADGYDRTYSLVDDVTGDDTAAAASFDAAQIGIYAQDEFVVSSALTLTAGIRLDVPILPSDPPALPGFNDTTIVKLAAAYPAANGARAGEAPSGQLMFSPRVGFTYNIEPSTQTVLRGGVGVFTSRIPFVWPGGMYSNNGTLLTSIDEDDISGPVTFRPDPNGQYTAEGPVGLGGQIDLFTDDFKYPQVLRTNLAVDHTLPGEVKLTFEGIFTKTLNNIIVTNINSSPDIRFTTTGAGGDQREVYTGRRIAPEVNGDVYLIDNTSQGYTYTVTAGLAKKFGRSLDATFAYTYGDAYAINEGTSSQNSSQWRGQLNVNGRNNPVFGRSDFALGHRVVGSLNYIARWDNTDRFATNFSIFGSGQTGGAYSYVVGPDRNRGAQNLNNETGDVGRNRSLIYIPANRSEINLVDVTNRAGEVTLSADEQWQNLNRFIEGDEYLSENRGQFADKNGSFAPFQGFFDVAIRQNLGFEAAGKLQRLQLSLDIFNFANLLNSNWGTSYNQPGDFNNRYLYNFVGYEPDGTTPRYQYTLDEGAGKESLNISGFGRWRARVGVRYIFN